MGRSSNDSSGMRGALSWGDKPKLSSRRPSKTAVPAARSPRRGSLNLFQTPRSSLRSSVPKTPRKGRKTAPPVRTSVFPDENVPVDTNSRASTRRQFQRVEHKDHFDECVTIRTSPRVHSAMSHSQRKIAKTKQIGDMRKRLFFDPERRSLPAPHPVDAKNEQPIVAEVRRSAPVVRISQESSATGDIRGARDLTSHWHHGMVNAPTYTGKAPGRQWEEHVVHGTALQQDNSTLQSSDMRRSASSMASLSIQNMAATQPEQSNGDADERKSVSIVTHEPAPAPEMARTESRSSISNGLFGLEVLKKKKSSVFQLPDGKYMMRSGFYDKHKPVAPFATMRCSVLQPPPTMKAITPFATDRPDVIRPDWPTCAPKNPDNRRENRASAAWRDKLAQPVRVQDALRAQIHAPQAVALQMPQNPRSKPVLWKY